MKRLEDRTEYQTRTIALAIHVLKNAEAAGFTHVRFSMARYVEEPEQPNADNAREGGH